MAIKKKVNGTWQPINPKQLKGIPYTGTLPAVLVGTKAGYLHSYKIYGNTEQVSETPTPENPIYPSECGELETTGVHAGQYKLPLTSAGQSVDIYLGESQTTRQIGKLVLTGEENITYLKVSGLSRFSINLYTTSDYRIGLCSHYNYVYRNADGNAYHESVVGGSQLFIFDNNYSSSTDFKAFLAQQYANGTPVTIWYVLATEETSTLNEPLRKIGNYADTIDSTQTSAQIPTTAGSTTISWAGSGLAPSEFDSIQEWVDIPTYKRVNGEWVADN